MGARVIVDYTSPGELRIELRQDGAEVIRFGVFVAVIVGALYALTPPARASPGWLLALLGLASAWSAIALTAQEVYTVDETEAVIVVTRTSLIGRRTRTVSMHEIGAVRLAMGGPDDDRRLVELVGRDGKVRLTIPRRLTTLTAPHQAEIGRLIAHQLSVPLRGSH